TANLGLFSALPYRGDTVLYDELIHASIRDGLNMSKAKSYSFKHNDLKDLEKRLQRAEGRIYVAVESVYSMDGDQAPLKQLAALCEKYQAALIVDEAHSNGIFGKQGRGLVSEIGIEKKVFARVMTFGKALGNHGAVVIGSQDLKDFLINYSRSFIYTTAPSPHQVFSVKNAYDKLSMSKDKILKLSKLVVLFKEKVKEFESLEVIPSESPIQCVLIAGNSKVKAVCRQVQEDGFDIRPIVAPTVPEGKERIRICIHSFNTEQEIIGLLDSINQHLENYGE
ncbi:MAG: 8-amino-7-oxononanoate synthase, partial [Urechidicola sp.]